MLRIFEYLFTDFQYIILCFYCILSLLFRTLGVRWLRDSRLICLNQSLPQIKISPDLTFLTKSSLGKLWIVPFIWHVASELLFVDDLVILIHCTPMNDISNLWRNGHAALCQLAFVGLYSLASFICHKSSLFNIYRRYIAIGKAVEVGTEEAVFLTCCYRGHEGQGTGT